MGLKAYLTADEYGALEASQQGFYAEEGEGYLVQVEGVGDYALENVGGLRKTNSKLHAECQQHTEKHHGDLSCCSALLAAGPAHAQRDHHGNERLGKFSGSSIHRS